MLQLTDIVTHMASATNDYCISVVQAYKLITSSLDAKYTHDQQLMAHPEHVCSEEGTVFLSSQLLVALLRHWGRSGGAQAQDGPQLLTNGLLLLRLHPRLQLLRWKFYLKEISRNVEYSLLPNALFKRTKKYSKCIKETIT